MWRRHLRAAIILGLGGFFLLGPVHTQVFLGPQRSTSAPWRPMAWHMYHSVGLDNCQGSFWAMREGARVDYSKAELEKALPRRRGTRSRWDAGRQVRERDVVWGNTYELTDLARLVCEREPDRAKADVRAYARCAPGEPGGRWVELSDGTRNLCAP